MALIELVALMARLFTCGFEENNFTATMWNVLNNAPTISTTSPHSGTYVMDTQNAASSSSARRNLATNLTSGTVYTRTYFKADDATPGGDTIILQCRNNAAGNNWTLSLLTTGILRLTNSATAGTFDGSTALSDATWYRIEVRHLISDTVGQLEVRLYLGDGTTALDTFGDGNFTGGDGSDADTLVTNVTQFDFGKSSAVLGTYHFDDIAINDATGTFQTSWAGPAKICMLVPNAEGATIEWTPLSGTDNSAMVDEMPAGAPDDATSYNQNSTAGQLDILSLTDMPAEVTSDATMKLADVWGRVGGDGTTGSPVIRLNFYDEGATKTAGPNCNKVDLSGFQIIATSDHCVVDLAGKTKANGDSFSAGYENVTDTAVNQRVTALWVLIEWLEAAGGGAPLAVFQRTYSARRRGGARPLVLL